MKNQRAVIMMAVAVLFGIAAVALAWYWMLGRSGTLPTRIVVASADVERGQRLAPDMLRLADVPAKDVPKDAFTDLSRVKDRILKENLSKGEVVSESMLAPPGTVGGLSALIPEGKRAITVRVNDVIGVAGFALPKNYVDVIVHTQRDAGAGGAAPGAAQHISKIVLERIKVLAVAQELNGDETKPKVVNAVTLEVTPEQAETLDLARGVGTLSLALRNQIDATLPDTAGATKRSLLDEPEPVVAAPPAARKTAPVARRVAVVVKSPVALARRDCVSVLNGLQMSQECF